MFILFDELLIYLFDNSWDNHGMKVNRSARQDSMQPSNLVRLLGDSLTVRGSTMKNVSFTWN